MKGVYTPTKKIDIGESYLIFVLSVQALAGEVNKAVTEDVGEQVRLIFERYQWFYDCISY